MLDKIYGENFKPKTWEDEMRKALPKKKTSSYSKRFIWVIPFLVIFYFWNHSSKQSVDSSNDSTPVNSSNSYQHSNDESYKSPVQDYSGTYYDYDQSTGRETTITVFGSSFYGKTIASTGDVIASASGTLTGSTLIDEYGQSVGSISGSSLSMTLGAATIYCRKR